MLINKISAAFCAAAILSTAASCSKAGDAAVPADALVVMGSQYLTRADLDKAVPPGLSPADSARLANAFIRSWIEARLVPQIAAKEIDMADIDQMVEQYRNELIMSRYTDMAYSANASSFSDDSLRAYFAANPDEFLLRRPMVKGVYLKVADDSKSLSKLRHLYRSHKEGDIDNLDKSQLDGAVHYDYFRDQWIDWEQIESRIPYDFGPSSDDFLRRTDHIDFSHGGFTYLLDIDSVLFSGQRMPYAAAEPFILEKLTYADKKAFTIKLRQDLYKKAVSEGSIKIQCDFDE